MTVSRPELFSILIAYDIGGIPPTPKSYEESKMARYKKFDLSHSQDVRRQRGENQSAFWGRFGVTQSGGSRYESGRAIPRPLSLLMGMWLAGEISDEQLALARKRIVH
jgi:hypothetical protein